MRIKKQQYERVFQFFLLGVPESMSDHKVRVFVCLCSCMYVCVYVNLCVSYWLFWGFANWTDLSDALRKGAEFQKGKFYRGPKLEIGQLENIIMWHSGVCYGNWDINEGQWRISLEGAGKAKRALCPFRIQALSQLSRHFEKYTKWSCWRGIIRD